MKKSILSILSLVIMLFACSTPQNSVTNNNTPPPTPPTNQVPTPVKPSSKYQKYKGGDQLMTAPVGKERATAENAEMVRDTM
jgi:hypothetical protein